MDDNNNKNPNPESGAAVAAAVAAPSASPHPEVDANKKLQLPRPVVLDEGLVIRNLRPNDIMLGRGSIAIGNHGNVEFRQIVAQRRNEYTNTNNRRIKDTIARQVMQAVANKKGRFVRKIDTKEEKKALGVAPDEDAWRVADHLSVLQKVKQSLRDKEPSSPILTHQKPKPTIKSPQVASAVKKSKKQSSQRKNLKDDGDHDRKPSPGSKQPKKKRREKSPDRLLHGIQAPSALQEPVSIAGPPLQLPDDARHLASAHSLLQGGSTIPMGLSNADDSSSDLHQHLLMMQNLEADAARRVRHNQGSGGDANSNLLNNNSPLSGLDIASILQMRQADQARAFLLEQQQRQQLARLILSRNSEQSQNDSSLLLQQQQQEQQNLRALLLRQQQESMNDGTAGLTGLTQGDLLRLQLLNSSNDTQRGGSSNTLTSSELLRLQQLQQQSNASVITAAAASRRLTESELLRMQQQLRGENTNNNNNDPNNLLLRQQLLQFRHDQEEEDEADEIYLNRLNRQSR